VGAIRGQDLVDTKYSAPELFWGNETTAYQLSQAVKQAVPVLAELHIRANFRLRQDGV
jgi:hypothetical protein